MILQARNSKNLLPCDQKHKYIYTLKHRCTKNIKDYLLFLTFQANLQCMNQNLPSELLCVLLIEALNCCYSKLSYLSIAKDKQILLRQILREIINQKNPGRILTDTVCQPFSSALLAERYVCGCY